MSVFDEPKIDTHCHLLDPVGFAYGADTPYRPAGQEIATLAQMQHVFAAYGVQHALIVQPNSGYGPDNSCLLDALAKGKGRFKGIAVVPLDISLDDLAALKAQGMVGVAFNYTFYDPSYYDAAGPLIDKLVALDMFLQLQFRDDQPLHILPSLAASPVKLLIDHCGRPDVAQGVVGAAFQALLELGRAGQAVVKLSGYIKFSAQSHPYADTLPFVRALLAAFTPQRCIWASDWPYLRAPERVDYGPLLTLAAALLPDPAERRAVMWDTPRRLFGFDTLPG